MKSFITDSGILALLQRKNPDLSELQRIYKQAPLEELMFAANLVRFQWHPAKEVSYLIDRNINYTNVCLSACKFCNFFRTKKSPEAFINSMDDYRKKIKELFDLGGRQILLQGGLHPDLGLEYYTSLFKNLKEEFPDLQLHALGPAEIVHIAKKESLDYKTVLKELINSGLDSLPGAGAEILVDRVRSLVSPAKCNSDQWLEVMEEAHQLNLITSATMMFGHLETLSERVEHLFRIRETHRKRPKGHHGFISFIPWPFAYQGTKIYQNTKITGVTPLEYVRLLAFSRLVLHEIPNIQASWLTVGYDTASLCLHSGANDMGSIMIEENVVSAAGKNFRLNKSEMCYLIQQNGFEPVLRNQRFEILKYEEY